MPKQSFRVYQQDLFQDELGDPGYKQKSNGESNYIFDIVDALSAPVRTFSQSWADTLPKRLLDLVPLARMKSLMMKERFACDVEIVIYIYTRTYEAPMDSDWTDIYTHISCKTLEEWFGENHWDTMGAPRKLSDWLNSQLLGLRLRIYWSNCM